MAAKAVKWGTVDVRAYEKGALAGSAASSEEYEDAPPEAVPRAERAARQLPAGLDADAAPPTQIFEGTGDRASAALEAERAADLIQANGLAAYEAADEGARAAAFAAGREARRMVQREFSAERARAVAARMEATAQLDPADALPLGFVTKLRDGHEAAVTYCTWADDSQHIASCDAQGKVCVWDTHSCTVRREYTGHTGAVTQVRALGPTPSQPPARL